MPRGLVRGQKINHMVDGQQNWAICMHFTIARVIQMECIQRWLSNLYGKREGEISVLLYEINYESINVFI